MDGKVPRDLNYTFSPRTHGSGKLPKFTLPKNNIVPENRPSQKDISFSNHTFSETMLVLGNVKETHRERSMGLWEEESKNNIC